MKTDSSLVMLGFLSAQQCQQLSTDTPGLAFSFSSDPIWSHKKCHTKLQFLTHDSKSCISLLPLPALQWSSSGNCNNLAALAQPLRVGWPGGLALWDSQMAKHHEHLHYRTHCRPSCVWMANDVCIINVITNDTIVYVYLILKSYSFNLIHRRLRLQIKCVKRLQTAFSGQEALFSWTGTRPSSYSFNRHSMIDGKQRFVHIPACQVGEISGIIEARTRPCKTRQVIAVTS